MGIENYSTDDRASGDLDTTKTDESIENVSVDNIHTITATGESKHTESLDAVLGDSEEKDDTKEEKEESDKLEAKEEPEKEDEEDTALSHRRPSIEKRISKLVQERNHYKSLLEAQVTKQGSLKEPDIKDYKDLPTYMKDLSKFQAASDTLESTKSHLEKIDKEELEQFQEEYDTKLDSFLKESKVSGEDFKKSVDSVEMSAGMIRAILGADNSPQIAYYLSKNKDVAKSLSKLNPLDAAREIGRIDAKFAKSTTKKVSAAPDPVKGIKKQSSAMDKDPSKMSQREYEEWYEKNKTKSGWGK